MLRSTEIHPEEFRFVSSYSQILLVRGAFAVSLIVRFHFHRGLIVRGQSYSSLIVRILTSMQGGGESYTILSLPHTLIHSWAVSAFHFHI